MKWIYLNNEITSKDEKGNLKLYKDKEAINTYQIEYVDKKYMKFNSLKEKLEYLIDNNYYYNIFEEYTLEDVSKVYEFVYDKNFKFESFMAISKFYQNYALKTDKGEYFLENYEDKIAIVALYLAKGDVNKALNFAKIMINQEYQPATPTFLNGGRKRSGELVSCFLDEIGDSLSNISYAFQEAMKLSSIGGGVAFNLSKLRARTEAIKEVENRASGVLPIMKILEDIFSYANQLGQRPGAGAVYLNIFHADLLEFLDCKKINVDEKIRIKSLSTGLIIPDKFMQLASKNEDYYLFYPHNVFTIYKKYLDDLDMDIYYDKLVNDERIRKVKVNPREILVKIAQSQKESGYPYLFFKDNANKKHALKNIGQINFSNLCTEIMQLSEVSTINDYYEKDEIRRGISCNLGSLNIARVMEEKNIEQTVKIAVEMLTQVCDITNISIVPSIKKANEQLHSIGLGAMNLHGYLAKNFISYESKEALDFCNTFFMMINYYSLEKSMQIAKERKKVFEDFEKSEYANGNYFKEYLENDYLPKTEKVKELFKDIKIPTVDDWEKLKENVMKYGIYHAYRLAIAPNQSTAYIMNATPSIMPIVDKIEVREYGDATTFYPMPYLSDENLFFYKSAYDMDQVNILKLVSVVQRHIDQGISTIVYTNSSDTTRDLSKLYILAHKLNLKSLYYTRTRKSKIEECFSCSV